MTSHEMRISQLFVYVQYTMFCYTDVTLARPHRQSMRAFM